MADPICRWRNSSVKQAAEFNLIFPLFITDKISGRKFVSNNWSVVDKNDFFATAYQLALQMGIYYEDDNTMYPRFNHILSYIECSEYMNMWGKNYYAPNPYTKSMDYSQKPVLINNFLVNWALDHINPKFSDALKEMFVDTIGNKDIFINMINNFTEVKIDNDIISLKNPNIKKYDNVYLDVDATDKKKFFEHFGGIIKKPILFNSNSPHQIIYYGAPGTGKSYSIEQACKKYKNFRTTFHPDSDYSTFVGAYKPVRDVVNQVDATGHFVKYQEGPKKGDVITEERITYKFVPQAFMQAYIEAWKRYSDDSIGEEEKKVFLIIEEINRGNCAQIFGDLFQLLDRDDEGYSKYAIKPDTDLENYLVESLGDKYDVDEGMKLPPNLYIWATMNTSDQSLFPIDSAFKRRWDWKYVPISKKDANYQIEVEKQGKLYRYDWWDFLDKVNTAIGNATSSEDKKLGYFFCKADKKASEDDENPSIITADRFVGKVIFYIWNDVFKDYEIGDAKFNYSYKDGEKKGQTAKLSLLSIMNEDKEEQRTFSSFFDEIGNANHESVVKLLEDLQIEGKEVDASGSELETNI